jgi:hypothetical protein
MQRYRQPAGVIVIAAMLCASTGWVGAQIPKTLMEFGQPIYPAYEGWYPNEDGSFSLLVGYFNPNGDQSLDVPIGDGNYLSPGPQDQGQPTDFPPGRQWGVFTIRVPADFGDNDITWHLTSNNQTVSIPFHLQPPYYIEPMRDAANGNEPPTVRFSADGEGHTGPPMGIGHTLETSVGTPFEIAIWTSDVKPTQHVRAPSNPRFRRPPLAVRWHKLRGPGDVAFDQTEQEFEDSTDQNPVVTATFSEPGEYILRVEALDSTGEGGSGFQCCWTSVHVRVNVS